MSFISINVQFVIIATLAQRADRWLIGYPNTRVEVIEQSKHLARPFQSTIREHSEGVCHKQVGKDEFEIIYRGKNTSETRMPFS